MDEAVAGLRSLRAGQPASPCIVTRAPGRVNLLGGHTDYNEGFVLPAATVQATYVAAAPRTDGVFRVWAEAFAACDEFVAHQLRPGAASHDWADYIRAVTWAALDAGIALNGLDAAIVGDLPIQAGVGSSASVEVAFALAILGTAETSLGDTELALLCQRAENEFVGMRCGALDQMASVLGREGSGLLLDCRSLEATIIPLGDANVSFVVCDTGKPRGLVDSQYNLRREQCELAARVLEVPALRDATLEGLEAKREELGEEVYRRARHVVTENQRVLEGAEALAQGEFELLGSLLLQAHESLRTDYEVSCPELDRMVAIAAEAPGCFGARLVGAGFGGCALAVVEAPKAQEFCETVEAAYKADVGLDGNTFVTRASAGASVVRKATA